LIAVLLLVPLAACRNEGARLAAGSGGEGVSPTVAAAHAQVASELSQADSADFSEATRGLVARATGKITAADGRVLRDLDAFAFVRGDAPPTVNPSLWRHAILDGEHGLFEVTPGIYQVRGFDLANITFIEGERGFVVVDPLTSAQPAAAALAQEQPPQGW